MPGTLRAFAAALVLLAAPAAAAELLAEAGGLRLEAGSARAAGPSARAGAGYLTMTNAGAEDDRLLAAASPAAERVEIHEHRLADGVARMTAVDGGIPVPADRSVALEPGGIHLMFLGLTESWSAGTGIPVTLVFERAGSIDVVLPVAEPPADHRHSPHADHLEGE